MAQDEHFPAGITEYEASPFAEYLSHMLKLREEAPIYFSQLLNRYWDSVPQEERLQISEEMPAQFGHSVESTQLYWQDYLVGRMARNYVAVLERRHAELSDTQIIQLSRGVDDGGEVERPAA